MASPDQRGWGQRLGGLKDGVPQRGPGAEPLWGLGGEADADTRFIVAKNRYFTTIYGIRPAGAWKSFACFMSGSLRQTDSVAGF